jgi:peptidoglycan/xylan/chitin deacetylase (PgdA/CDA1 family)
VRDQAQVLSVTELSGAIEVGRLPRRAVVLTFDDGYADNLLAKSLLEKRGLAATLFLSTGALDSSHEFWWDELERIFCILALLKHWS